jgi:hypothetical protein
MNKHIETLKDIIKEDPVDVLISIVFFIFVVAVSGLFLLKGF